jgi:hypothetical protein
MQSTTQGGKTVPRKPFRCLVCNGSMQRPCPNRPWRRGLNALIFSDRVDALSFPAHDSQPKA